MYISDAQQAVARGGPVRGDTGVAVPEVGHGRESGAAYLGALAAYASGTPQGVALWLTHCGEAIVAGALEGTRIADAVRAGRLG